MFGINSRAKRRLRLPVRGASSAPCEPAPRALKPEERTRSFFMTAILTILVFLVVIGGLNYFEFGRLD